MSASTGCQAVIQPVLRISVQCGNPRSAYDLIAAHASGLWRQHQVQGHSVLPMPEAPRQQREHIHGERIPWETLLCLTNSLMQQLCFFLKPSTEDMFIDI